MYLSGKSDIKVRLKQAKSWAVMPSSLDKEVIAMEYVYIMIYIITLIVLIITIKKSRPRPMKRYFL